MSYTVPRSRLQGKAASLLARKPVLTALVGLLGLGCLFSGRIEVLLGGVLLLACMAVASATALVKAISRSPAPGVATAPERKSWAATKDAFVAMADDMLAQTLRKRQPLSVLVMEQIDLAELAAIFGADVAQRFVRKLAATLRRVAPGRGVVVRTDAAVFAVLLPGLTRDEAHAAVKDAFGATLSIEVDAGEEEVTLVPDFLIRTVVTESVSIATLYDDMRRVLARARTDEVRRQDYLRREHESHCTRPAPLPLGDSQPVRYVRHEQTIPVPLGMR